MWRKTKGLISGFIALTMVLGMLSGDEIGTVDVIPNINTKCKVHFEGMQVSLCESSSEIADVINEDGQKLNTNLIIELDNYWETDRENFNMYLSMEEAQNLLREHRENAKAYYSKTNNDILKQLNIKGFDISFSADSYAPYIVAEFDRDITSKDVDNIYQLAAEEGVSNIYVQNVKKEEIELENAVNAINGAEIVADATYDGAGVVVGILDCGLVKEENEIFDSVEVIPRNEWWYNEAYSNHATQVAACALAIAPSVTLLSVERDGDIHGEVEWMLDHGVNVINISMGIFASGEEGAYNSTSAYCDYIAREYSVVFTGSAGNRAAGDGDAMVTPPNGYNTLTIGACNNLGDRRKASSYEEKFNINFPNFLAPGTDLVIPGYEGTYSGTSYAAPFVAGAAAVIMQKAPYLMLHPECVMAILMATTERIERYSRSSGFNDEAGTGMLNVANAIASCRMCTFFEVDENQIGEFVSVRTFYLKKGERIRVAFVSLINNGSADVSTSLVTDYDLYLYNNKNTQKAGCAGTYNNEFIDYVVEESGYYTNKIKQYAAKKTGYADKCAYAYFITEE